MEEPKLQSDSQPLKAFHVGKLYHTGCYGQIDYTSKVQRLFKCYCRKIHHDKTLRCTCVYIYILYIAVVVIIKSAKLI